MRCAWKDLLDILPIRMRPAVDKLGRETAREIRLRINAPPELVCSEKSINLEDRVREEDLSFCINVASRYSPWTATSVSKGYLTAPGGHRIGLCGETVLMDGKPSTIKNLTSLCIRIARDYPGIGERLSHCTGSILILGAPGWGKTTLLRDLCRIIGKTFNVAVIDERKELFPPGIPKEGRLDVLSGCPKVYGIDMALRTLGPNYLAVDEITAREDCESLIQAYNCGVHLLASAHGASLRDYKSRNIYKPLARKRIFDTVAVLHRDQSYTLERMDL